MGFSLRILSFLAISYVSCTCAAALMLTSSSFNLLFFSILLSLPFPMKQVGRDGALLEVVLMMCAVGDLAGAQTRRQTLTFAHFQAVRHHLWPILHSKPMYMPECVVQMLFFHRLYAHFLVILETQHWICCRISGYNTGKRQNHRNWNQCRNHYDTLWQQSLLIWSNIGSRESRVAPARSRGSAPEWWVRICRAGVTECLFNTYPQRTAITCHVNTCISTWILVLHAVVAIYFLLRC